jgi:TM2 domain-containing membrane protein YozV
LQFYRDHLNGEYKSLLQQANTTYKLWLCCVLLGFLVLIAGVVAMLAGFIGQGIATAASTIIVFFIQKIFQQREDHYRDLARAKNGHLEYGNQWLLVIQSIDSIIDIEQRKRRQEKLVDVLTAKLSESSQVTAKPRVTKRKKGKAKA